MKIKLLIAAGACLLGLALNLTGEFGYYSHPTPEGTYTGIQFGPISVQYVPGPVLQWNEESMFFECHIMGNRTCG